MEMKGEHCVCESVKGPVPLTMYHALSCKKYGGLILRHDLVKRVFADLFSSAKLVHEVEPPQAFEGNKQRPDIVVRNAWKGQDAAYDITIENPVRNAQSVRETIKNDQKFLKTAYQTKYSKYEENCRAQGMLIFPIVLSAFGGIVEESYRDGIEVIIHKVEKKQFNAPNWAAPTRKAYWLQRIAVALWKGNARKLSSFVKKGPLEAN